MSSLAQLTWSRPLPLALLVMPLVSCVASTAQLPATLDAPAVAVERDRYRVRRTRNGDMLELTVVATFTNRTADTIVLHPCYERRPAVALEKWVDGEWKSAFGQACPDVLFTSAPRLAPGESQTDTAWIFAALGPDS